MKDNNIQSVLNKQRLDKFRMVITLPPILRDLNTSDWSTIEQTLINRDSLQFSLFTATIPEVSIPAKILPTMGQKVKITSQVRDAYPPISCKSAVDNRFKNYWVLWKWLEVINNPTRSGMDGRLALTNDGKTVGQIPTGNANFWDYQTIISIFPLDEYNKDMCEFIFTNAFITKLGGANFNYQDPNQLESEFVFDFGQMDIKILD